MEALQYPIHDFLRAARHGEGILSKRQIYGNDTGREENWHNILVSELSRARKLYNGSGSRLSRFSSWAAVSERAMKYLAASSPDNKTQQVSKPECYRPRCAKASREGDDGKSKVYVDYQCLLGKVTSGTPLVLGVVLTVWRGAFMYIHTSIHVTLHTGFIGFYRAQADKRKAHYLGARLPDTYTI